MSDNVKSNFREILERLNCKERIGKEMGRGKGCRETADCSVSGLGAEALVAAVAEGKTWQLS